MKTGLINLVCKLSTILLVSLIVIAVGTQAQATTITIDPGPIGVSPWEFDTSFTELNSTSVAGQSLSLDFVFAADKWILIDGSHWVDMIAQFHTDYSGWVEGNLPGTFSLLNEFGAPLFAPLPLYYPGGWNNGGILSAQTAPLYLTRTRFYGIHYDITLPDMTGTSIMSANTRFIGTSRIGVPEPGTMLLFGAGLAGLGLLRKIFKA